MLQLLLPRLHRFISVLTDDQWQVIDQVAGLSKQGFCKDMRYIADRFQEFRLTLGKIIDGVLVLCPEKLVSHLQMRFWDSAEPGSRHH
jgi:ribosomal protein S8